MSKEELENIRVQQYFHLKGLRAPRRKQKADTIKVKA